MKNTYNVWTRKHVNLQAATLPKRQSGAVLLIALVGLSVMGIGALSLNQMVDAETSISGNLAFREAAVHSSDVGVETAAAQLTQLFLSGDKEVNDPAINYIATYDPDVPVPIPTTANQIDLTAAGNKINYITERLCTVINTPTSCVGDPNTHFRTTVQVLGPRNSESWFQVFFKEFVGALSKLPAILTNGDLTLSGNAIVTGSKAGVHVNGSLDISGDPDIQGTITVTGTATYDASKATGYNETTGEGFVAPTEGANPVEVPTVDPTKYKKDATHLLTADGKVYSIDNPGLANSTKTLLADLGTNGNKWAGWDFSASNIVLANGDTLNTWTLSSGTNAVDGRYYVEGNANISGNPGAQGPNDPPWQATLIAEGNIEVSGNPKMVPYNQDKATNPDLTPSVTNFIFISGYDLKINGNTTQNQDPEFQGVMAAHEQVDISGNPQLGGYILAENASNYSDVAKDGNHISGSMNLKSGGDVGAIPGQSYAYRLAWRELER